MNEGGKQQIGAIPLQLQPGLDHRGVFGSRPEGARAPLFPPAGTFEALGGRAAVAGLVDGLYDRIEMDTVLRPAFNRDLARERARQKLFFEAWFGGAPTYFDAMWPPGLKAAHGSVSISRGMAGHWLSHFLDSLAAVVKDPALITEIRPLIFRLALALVNRTDEPVPGERLRDVSDPRFLRAVQRDDSVGLAAITAAQPQVFMLHGPKLLLIAAARGKSRIAEELLRQGVDVNAVAMLPGSDAKTYGLPMLRITPLCGALANHRASLVNLLVEHGAQYDIFTAAYVGDLEAVEALLDLAPDLADAPDPGCDVAQVTPLLHAVFAGQFEVAQLLLQRGATVGVNSVRLVRAAANRGDEALTDLLLAHGANPASIGAGEWVMVPAIADKLLARGANVNQEPGAWVGLCCTGNSGHKENAALAWAMLRCGADVTAPYKGRTALHCAAKAGFVNVVEALLEHGSDVNALNERGQTPLDEVENAGRSIDRAPMRRLLIAHQARRSKHEAPE
ncbi:MAG: ankyrin repeat domain-containing protein [Chloroflexi bacterium]|nr:ankyrin repeat domain-containing protein [Chloroflexota bacterium]